MPIFHALPLKEIPSNRLLVAYHEGLRQHWGMGERMVGKMLRLLELGTGFSPAEKGFLSAEVRRSGLSMAERRGVHRMLNSAGYPLSTNVLRNKALFAKHVRDHGLAAPATYDPERNDLAEWLAAHPRFVAKRGYSSKGKGVAAFSRDGGDWRGPDDRRLSTEALAAELRTIVAQHGVAQERVTADEALRDISPHVLPTLRVVTCIDESGAPEAAAIVLRLGGGGPRPVDNFNAGGLAVRLDEHGQCELAFRARGRRTEQTTVHPTTGVAIAGRQVPAFDDAIRVGCEAHRTLPPGYTVVGWDIGLSDRGPLLIEGNWNHGTDIVQLVSGQGLDRTRLGELYRYHLARISPDQWRATKPIEW